MDSWFASISAETRLSSDAVYALQTDGFIVLPGPVTGASLAELARLYDEAVSAAPPDDTKVGSTTTRVGLVAKTRPVREDPDPPRFLVLYVPLTTQRRDVRMKSRCRDFPLLIVSQ